VSAGRTEAFHGPLEVGERRLIAELGDALRAAGLTGERLRKALGLATKVVGRKSDIAVHERRLAGVEPLGPIVRLFVLERPVAVAEAARALEPVPLSHLEQLGLAAVEDANVRPLVRIVPHDEILIVSDHRVRSDEEEPDYVAGVHGPSLTLSHLTVRRPVETTLDVGTGSGVQAILAARHSERVVATDLNERALNFAEFNTALNGVDNVEFRVGSFFEPAGDERFQLVTSNPPYVISPESAFLFRDSGLEGDAVSRHVVGAAPAHLDEGGFASILVSWVHQREEDWSAPLRAWVDGSDCDAWLLHHGTDDPLSHAARWNRNDFADDQAALGEVLDRWLEYFERLGIEGIAYGAVILRRRSEGENWVRADELAGDRLQPASEQILRVFDAADYLNALPHGRAMLDETFALADAARLEQHGVLEQGEWALAEIALSLEEGAGFRATLDPGTAELLAALDGRRPLAAVVDDLAARQEVDREGLAEDAIGVVRGLLGAGFLVRGSSQR
jgi:methylase of polypeptide subunit release factors